MVLFSDHTNSGLPTMPHYRTYFRDSNGKIIGTQILDCEDDSAAAVKLEILLAERTNCTLAEVWEGEYSSIAPCARGWKRMARTNYNIGDVVFWGMPTTAG